MLTNIQNLDWSILNYIQNNLRSPSLDKLMVFFTSIGDLAAVWIFIAIIFLLIKQRRITGIKIIIGLIIVGILGDIIFKNYFARFRPFLADLSIDILIKRPVGYSFPSGHSFSSFVAATIIFIDDRRLGYVALVIATLIALSRIYLFVHFPTDIFAGMILGIILAILINSLYTKYGVKYKHNSVVK